MWSDHSMVQTMSTLPYFNELVNDDNNNFGLSPLVWAATQGPINLDSLSLLKKHGCDLMKPNPKDLMTVLHVGAATNDVKLLDFVL